MRNQGEGETNCQHVINISNFQNHETVSYPIIKLIGTIDLEGTSICQSEPDSIYLCKTGTSKKCAKIQNNKFKFIIELDDGKNNIILTYCSKNIDIIIEYLKDTSRYSVLPLYIICEGTNGKFQSPETVSNSVESACRRIHLGSKLLQCVTAEKLYEHNLGRKTFRLENECKVFKSCLNYLEARKMNQEQLWEYFGREIMHSEFGDKKKKYLCFLSCTWYNGDRYTSSMEKHEDLVGICDGYVALGGGGLALFGSACLYTWPETFDEVICKFEDDTPVDRTRFLDDSCYRGTYGACFSTTLGSVLHELYHTFNLGHTACGIMGRGFDDIYKVFTINKDKDPHQDISKAFQNKIEFKEEFEAEMLSERLQNETKKKDFSIIRKYDETDDTHLSKSCAVLLYYHRWFNAHQDITKNSLLSYDKTNRFIKSTAGIRVIEIRNESDETVLTEWTFEGKVFKIFFQLPEETFNPNWDVNNLILVVEDSNGNILKEKI